MPKNQDGQEDCGMADFNNVDPAKTKKKKKRQHADEETGKCEPKMTKNQDGQEDWGMADFNNVGPAKNKKKTKKQHADEEAGKCERKMTNNQDGQEDWGVGVFYNVGPAKTKKKKKKQHADKEAEKVSLIDEKHNENLDIDGLPSLDNKEHMKKMKQHEANFLESDMLCEIEHYILESESHHIRSKQSAEIMKRSVQEEEDNEWKGNINDAVNQRDEVRDECSFRVKKHKKRKSYSLEIEAIAANIGEDCVAGTLKESTKIEGKPKKSKDKPRKVEIITGVETGEVDILDTKNLGLFTGKEKYADQECRPEKKRKKKPKQAREEHAFAEHEQIVSVVSNWETNGDQGFLWQTKHSTELANLEEFPKTKQTCKSLKYEIKKETVEVPISTLTETCIAEPVSLSDEISDERSFAEVTHMSTHKERKRKKQKKAQHAVSAVNERSCETENMGNVAVDDSVLADVPGQETALNLLEDFIPNIRTKSQCTIRSLIKYDLQRFLTFKEQGIPIRFGRFSAEENEQLQRNMEAYLELTGIDSADKIFHPFRYPEEAKAIQQAKRQHLLCNYIGRGLPRPWSLVKRRAQKIFDPYNYKGRYSLEEINELRRHQATCGNNWSQVSNRMARSNHSVALKFSQLRNPINNKGSWSKAEMKRLLQSVQHFLQNTLSHNELENMASAMAQRSTDDVMSLARDKLYKGISWVEVEAKVGTRNWMQCKLKWTSFLTKKMTRGVKVYHGKNALRAKIRLIQRLYESQVEDSSELNWEELADCIGNVPPSYVQTKFYRLKSRFVPSWNAKTFTEIVDYLHDVILPDLQSKLKDNKTVENTPREERQRVYTFADIFQDSDLDDSDPEDH